MRATTSRKPGPRQAGDARERILAAASELFYREGIRGVGVDAVVRESGVAKMTLYAHFRSKDELVAACLERQGEACRARFGRVLAASPETARGKLDAFFGALAEWFAEPGFRGCPFINASSEIGDPAHSVRRLAAEHQQFLRETLLGIARLAPGADAGRLAEDWLLVVEGAIVLATTRGDAVPAHKAHALAVRLLGGGAP